MILLLCGLLAAAPPSESESAVGPRIAASASAAERLQGPLDGAWIVRDGHGRTLLRLQIEDPPQRIGSPTGAWSLADGSAMGPIDRIEATRGTLEIAIRPGEWLVLRREPQRWRGRLTQDRRVILVTLARR
ncbi:MAG TPA: hypothetical protein VGH03_03910 [Caulobacteraceae bacterium]